MRRSLVMALGFVSIFGCYGPPAAGRYWQSFGPGPDPTEVNLAIAVVRETYPDLPGGYVYWTGKPFPCETAAANSSGCNFPTAPISMEILYLPGMTTITDTSFVYQIGDFLHVAPDGSTALQAWSDAMNAKIAAALGAMR